VHGAPVAVVGSTSCVLHRSDRLRGPRGTYSGPRKDPTPMSSWIIQRRLL